MATGNDLAFQKLRAFGYTGTLGDMLAEWGRDNPTVQIVEILGPDVWNVYWDSFGGGGGGVPANSITAGGHNLTIGGHFLVWS